MVWWLFLIWIVLNGRVTADVLISGAAVSVGIGLLSGRILGLRPWGSRKDLARLPQAAAYILSLVGQVLLANLHMARRILAPGSRAGKGRLVWFDTGLSGQGSRLLLANSITLTPGTVTAALHEGKIWIYALDESFAGGLRDSKFCARLKQWEGEGR